MRTQQITRMENTDDAFTLVSEYDSPIERAYASYANKMKSLANQARLDILSAGKIAYSSEAKKQYSNEVKSLNDKLEVSLMNAPKERSAQLIANSIVKAKTKENPDISKEEKKKIAQQALTQARIRTGAKRNNIEISNEEWNAIQAGAISETMLTQILDTAAEIQSIWTAVFSA